MLYLCHYPLITEHIGQRRMCDLLQRDFYWLHMASDIQRKVAQSVSRARTGNRYRHKRRL